MIDETLLVKDYLEGKNINKKISYRMCYLLSKWYKENGIDNKYEIRKLILSWANKYNLYLNINLNDCITKALDNNRRLTYDNPIRISDDDILEIKERFDGNNVRLVALGFLCYAKQFANQDGEFEIPIGAFGIWLGIDSSNIINRYIPELIDFSYIKKVEPAVVRTYKGITRSKMTKYKMNVPIRNNGEYEIKNNNIRLLYDEIFN